MKILFVISIFIFMKTEQQKKQYKWPQSDNRFNAVVGIRANNQHLCTGIWVTERYIVTSANPVMAYKFESGFVTVVTMDGLNSVKELGIMCIANAIKRKETWIRTGYGPELHTVIHDIAIVSVPSNSTIERTIRNHYPFPISLTQGYYATHLTNWMMAGFSYTDKENIRSSLDLITFSYDIESLTNCYEYLPAKWGHFICVKDQDRLAALASGAPLITFTQKGSYEVVGIGSFYLTKGQDKILVFTDATKYLLSLHGCFSNEVY